MKFQRSGGFTLIELLIVIGLLGALTALILPSLAADRSEALGEINQYNKAGTARALYEYHGLFGEYPDYLHTGTDANDSVMDGMPAPMKKAVHGTTATLTASEAESLNNVGIDTVCYDTGLNTKAVEAGVVVLDSTEWTIGGSTTEMTFEGRTPTEWIEDTYGDASSGRVIALYLTPTTDWSGTSGNSDWTKGAVELGISMEGQCPLPTTSVDGGDVDFAYYAAHFLVDSTGADDPEDAILLGVTCTGGNPLNP